MAFIVDPKIEEYAEQHTTPDGELFERLAEETRAKTTAPQMMVGRIEGRFLATLVALSGARRILEFGTFTGYSSISMASALPPDGKILTLDVDPEATAIARRYMDESGHGDKIEIRLGPALESLHDVAGPFDLVFIDADKQSNSIYIDWAARLGRSGTVVVVDNVGRGGEVANPATEDPMVIGTQRGLELLGRDPRFDATALQTLDLKGWDGVAIAVVV
jgi:predicted O-methyltransferase YrrM